MRAASSVAPRPDMSNIPTPKLSRPFLTLHRSSAQQEMPPREGGNMLVGPTTRSCACTAKVRQQLAVALSFSISNPTPASATESSLFFPVLLCGLLITRLHGFNSVQQKNCSACTSASEALPRTLSRADCLRGARQRCVRSCMGVSYTVFRLGFSAYVLLAPIMLPVAQHSTKGEPARYYVQGSSVRHPASRTSWS